MRALSVILTLSLLACVLMTLLPEERAISLLEEHGVIEMASAILPLITIATLAPLMKRSPDAILASAVLLLFSYREADLDFHKRFFSMNIGRAGDYFSPAFPWAEKIAALFILLFLGGLLLTLLWRNVSHVTQQIRRQEPHALQLLTALFLLLFSENLSEALLNTFFDEAPKAGIFFLATEEIAELAAQLLLLFSALAYGKTIRGGRG